VVSGERGPCPKPETTAGKEIPYGYNLVAAGNKLLGCKAKALLQAGLYYGSGNLSLLGITI
jgi:hypothetical protein